MQQLERIRIMETDALVVVDPQNDFLPGGSLAVCDGNRIFEPINRVMPLFDHVWATRDWHPPEHAYFTEHGGIWPFHCLQGTPGAEFSNLLDQKPIQAVISKGTNVETDGYSAFAETDFARQLHDAGVTRVFFCGLATDYCVKMSALDSMQQGFETFVLTDAIAAVNVHAGDDAAALKELETQGVRFATTGELSRR